ncbi:hypothetical protein KAS50_04330, partial [bacterium]|nr:hypothetical protein [bacterium]
EYIEDHPYENTFVGWNSLAATKGYTPGTALDIYRWIHRPKDYGDEPDMMFDVGAGGSVPLIPNTKFYTSHFWNKSFYYLPKSCREFSTEFTGTGKLTNRIKSNMNLVTSFIFNRVAALGSEAQNFNPTYGYVVGSRGTDDSGAMRGEPYNESFNVPKYNKNYYGSIKFTHTYSARTYYDLEVGVQRGFIDMEHMRLRDITKIKFIDDPILAASGWLERNIETGETYGYPAGRIAFDEIPRGWYIHNATNSRTSNTMISTADQIDRSIAGIQYQWAHVNNTTLNFKSNIVSQVNKYNQVKAGFDFNSYYVNHRAYRDNGSAYFEKEEDKPSAFSIYTAKPWQFDAYVQDKLEWEGMIVN